MATLSDTFEAESPGHTVTPEQLHMICCRYYTAAQYVAGKTVLEIGCGPGIGLGYLIKKGARTVIGGDYSETNIRLAQKHYKGGVHLTVLDAQSLPFQDKCFNEVVVFEVMYYLNHPERFLSECHRVLKDNGILVICIANKDLPGFRRSPLSTRYFSVPELYNILTQRNFSSEISGAFPLSKGTTFQKLWAGSILLVGKILNHVPKGKRIKEFLNKIILGKDIVLKEEITDENMASQTFELTPLAYDTPDFRHKILYARCHVKNVTR